MSEIKYLFKFQSKIIFSAILIFIFLGAGYQQGDDDIYTKINKNMDVFGKVYKEIAINYVDEIETDKFLKAGIEGMLNTLDPYTTFLDESRKDEIDLITTGKYGGVGISIGLKDSVVIITEILEGYSAQKEGLKKGDIILEVDGNIIDGEKIGDVKALVRGTPGTSLKMKIKRKDKEFDFTLTREEIKLKNVSYKTLLDGNIAYIKLDRFNKNAETEVVEAITELSSKTELKGLILDLRDNPGGLLDAAIGILNKIIPKGNLLLTTKGRKNDSERKFFSSETPMIKNDIPLVALVNQNSASASEIVAGAIQDLDRGVIIGTKTFGKGLVQIHTPLSYGNQLKITTQKYFTPSGRWIQSKNYFKENKYGVFKTNPYYSNTEFKTLNGRTVFAEGGITPDTLIDNISDNELLSELSLQDMYLKFAEKYVNENPDGSNFRFTDDILSSFYNFINSDNFEYSSSAEKELVQLQKVIESGSFSSKIKDQISLLSENIRDERLNQFDLSKPVIVRNLTMEILKKYKKSEEEILKISIADDLQLQTALGIIKNNDVYNNILNIR